MQYLSFLSDREKLFEIRKNLYVSNGPGFYVFKNYLDKNFVEHLRNFWVKEANISKGHKVLTSIGDKSRLFYYGCPNYLYKTKFGYAYYNYFWNKPIDEVAHSVSFSIQLLRNLIQSSKNYQDFFPIEGNSCSYRVVVTTNGDQIVPPHRDWNEGKYFVPSKLQATLILSKKGIDYNGTGMKMQSNDKSETYIFDGNMEVNPGDLVLWRYNSLHSVEDVKTSEGQIGFMRMIFPPEVISPRSTEDALYEFSTKDLVRHVNSRLLKKFKLKK